MGLLLLPAWANGQEAESEIEAQFINYKASIDKATATLSLPKGVPGTNIAFKVDLVDGKMPPLDVHLRLLDRLLTQVLQDRPSVRSMNVLFGTTRDFFFGPLDESLARSPEWDPVRGRPKHGQLGEFLVKAINAGEVTAKIAEVFRAHGFSFKLIGMNRIDIQKAPALHNARVPVHIYEMIFVSEKIAN